MKKGRKEGGWKGGGNKRRERGREDGDTRNEWQGEKKKGTYEIEG